MNTLLAIIAITGIGAQNVTVTMPRREGPTWVALPVEITLPKGTKDLRGHEVESGTHEFPGGFFLPDGSMLWVQRSKTVDDPTKLKLRPMPEAEDLKLLGRPAKMEMYKKAGRNVVLAVIFGPDGEFTTVGMFLKVEPGPEARKIFLDHIARIRLL